MIPEPRIPATTDPFSTRNDPDQVRAAVHYPALSSPKFRPVFVVRLHFCHVSYARKDQSNCDWAVPTAVVGKGFDDGAAPKVRMDSHVRLNLCDQQLKCINLLVGEKRQTETLFGESVSDVELILC